jgi:hypothetical protein
LSLFLKRCQVTRRHAARASLGSRHNAARPGTRLPENAGNALEMKNLPTFAYQ